MGDYILLTVATSIISGSLATIITIIVNRRQDILETKRKLVGDLFGYKYQLTSLGEREELSMVLGKVPIIFYGDKEVLDSYDRLFEILSNANRDLTNKMADDALVSFYKSVCKAAKLVCAEWNDSRFLRVLK